MRIFCGDPHIIAKYDYGSPFRWDASCRNIIETLHKDALLSRKRCVRTRVKPRASRNVMSVLRSCKRVWEISRYRYFYPLPKLHSTSNEIAPGKFSPAADHTFFKSLPDVRKIYHRCDFWGAVSRSRGLRPIKPKIVWVIWALEGKNPEYERRGFTTFFSSALQSPQLALQRNSVGHFHDGSKILRVIPNWPGRWWEDYLLLANWSIKRFNRLPHVVQYNSRCTSAHWTPRRS